MGREGQRTRDARFGRTQAILAAALFAGALALYVATLAPSILWGDGGELQCSAHTGAIPHPTGYPTWVLLGRLFAWLPIGDLAWRVNLSSAVYGAAAVLVLFALLVRCGVRDLAALSAAAVLGASRLFWSQAVVTEVYTLNVLLLAIAALLALTWKPGGRARHLVAIAVVAAVGAGNHASFTALLPLVALHLVVVDPGVLRRWPALLGCTALFAVLLVGITFSPLLHSELYASVPFSDLLRASTWKRTWAHATGAQYESLMFDLPWREQPARVAGLLLDMARWLTPVGALLALVGLWRVLAGKGERRTRFLVPAAIAANVALFLQVDFADQSLMFLPSLFFAAVLSGLGLDRALELTERLRPLAGRALASSLLVVPPLALLAFNAHLDETNDGLSQDRGARAWAESVFEALPEGSICMAEWVCYWPLAFLRQVEGRRPDVTVRIGSKTWFAGRARGPISEPLYLAGPLAEVEALVDAELVPGIAPPAVLQRLTAVR